MRKLMWSGLSGYNFPWMRKVTNLECYRMANTNRKLLSYCILKLANCNNNSRDATEGSVMTELIEGAKNVTEKCDQIQIYLG